MKLHPLFAVLTLSLTYNFPTAIGQTPTSVSQLRELIAESRCNDIKISDAANKALSKLDSRSLPALISILNQGQPCEQVTSAQLISKFGPKNSEIVPVMTKVTRGVSLRTLFNFEEEMMCRRAASYALVRSAEGIRQSPIQSPFLPISVFTPASLAAPSRR